MNNFSELERDKPQDECGVYAIYSSRTFDISNPLFYGLYALQHRGQESCGMAIVNGNHISYVKNMGLVNDVFDSEKLKSLPDGDIALGHVRYASKGIKSAVTAQPMVYSGKVGMFAIAMNGKVTNANILRNTLKAEGVMFQTEVDCEVIATLINKYSSGNIREAVKKAVAELEGSFALVVITTTELIAARDRFGLRPMVIGINDYGDHVFASESCALDATAAELVRDLLPGEIVSVDAEGLHSVFFAKETRRPCIFEYVYTARADSIIDDRSVYQARYECGRVLAKRLNIKADIVAGVPDSAVVAARGYAAESGIPYIDVLEKNRYVGRTFIQPTQYMRENSVRIKLNTLRSNIKDKSIILIDDSIVRGTTSRKIVDLLKKTGAKAVHMVIASPIVKHPCYTGIDIETYEQLIGAKNDAAGICKEIGADSIHFMDVKDLIDSCKTVDNTTFCCGCFDGDYPEDIENVLTKRGEI